MHSQSLIRLAVSDWAPPLALQATTKVNGPRPHKLSSLFEMVERSGQMRKVRGVLWDS